MVVCVSAVIYVAKTYSLIFVSIDVQSSRYVSFWMNERHKLHQKNHDITTKEQQHGNNTNQPRIG